MSPKVVGGILLAFVVTFGIGWLAGASGKAALEQALGKAAQVSDFAEARALISDGRVSLFLVNFGDASKRFEEARGVVERAPTRVAGSRAGRARRASGDCRDAPARRAAPRPLPRFVCPRSGGGSVTGARN